MNTQNVHIIKDKNEKKPLYVALSFRCVFVCVYVCIHRAATANYEENRQTREKEKKT